MDVEITKMSGDSFRLSEHDVTVRDFNVSSVPVSGIYGTVEGRSGTVDYGADFGQRPISVPFFMKANVFADYPLLRDELFSLMVSREPFYIREMRRETYGSINGCGSDDDGDRFVGGKRYKVRISGSFIIDQQFRYGFGELSFETVESPFAESIGTTQDIQQNGISANDEFWGFGMGLLSDDSSHIYTHTIHQGETISIYNAGNVSIHPFDQELKIEITNVYRSRQFFELNNQTNGSTFRVTEPVASSSEIIYDGPNIRIDGLEGLRRTNRKYIQLNPGWNVFSIDGAESADIAFDFPFYYL